VRSKELLQTKLQRSRVPRHFVPRPRLTERLDQGAQGPLTLVCAGAGYGKTTLVSSWIESLAAIDPSAARVPVAWISLDERDSDLGIFLRYFVAGLRSISADACPATSRLLQATRQPPFDVLSATLINEIASLPHDFILVLDDHQWITGTAVHELLAEFEHHWPQPMHLVLLSRHVPALSLASMRAKGQLTEIRARDLRFTPDETAAYLKQALPAPLSKRALELLERRTEGWIAGLQLASLLLRDAEDPEGLLTNLSDEDAGFAEYLADDVLAHQPAPVLSFLLQTAILENFCAELCEAVVSSEDPEWSARQCIDWIERRNLFVSSLDGRREWYGYHQIFRSVLLERSKAKLGPDGVSGLHSRAAAWFAQRGQADEAVRHALAAGDRDLAAGFVAQGLRDVLNREDRPTLQRWLALFPDEFVQDHLDLLIVQAFSLFLSWQLSPLARVLPRAAALLGWERSTTSAGIELGVLRGCLSALSAFVAYFGNDFEGAAAYSLEALTLLPEEWLFVRGGGVLFKVSAMQARGQWQAAVRLLTENYESLVDRASVYALRYLQGLCLVNYRQAGDLEQVMQTGQKLADEGERSGLSLLQSWGVLYVGLAHYQRNDLSAARECFSRLLEFRYTGNIGALRDGVQRLSLIHQLAGEQAQAREAVHFLSQVDLEQMGHEGDETRALRARLWLMSGELGSAAHWADEFTAPVPDQAWPWQDPPHLIKARILLARGTAADMRSALEILAALYEVAERSHNMRLLIEVLALRALALGAAGKATDARAALLAAIDLAWPGGFLRPFVDLGAPMQEALNQLTGQQDFPGPAAVRRILVEFGDQPAGAASGGQEAERSDRSRASDSAASALPGLQPLTEPLSRRELEVMRLLCGPMTLKEIAARLFISYQTVKRHTANIYGKLGVNKRSAAVARARALGLVPRE
jgi:LuxR family transcriptional regulator, maltose regulon positive regulatory protein